MDGLFVFFLDAIITLFEIDRVPPIGRGESLILPIWEKKKNQKV